MTLEEAIKVLTEDTQHPTAGFMPELLEAQKLGIEALKRLGELRRSRAHYPSWVLPGETKE